MPDLGEVPKQHGLFDKKERPYEPGKSLDGFPPPGLIQRPLFKERRSHLQDGAFVDTSSSYDPLPPPSHEERNYFWRDDAGNLRAPSNLSKGEPYEPLQPPQMDPETADRLDRIHEDRLERGR